MHTSHHDDTPVPWRNSLSSMSSSGCMSMDGQSAFRPVGPEDDNRRFRLRAYAREHAKRGSSVPLEASIPFPVTEEDIDRDQLPKSRELSGRHTLDNPKSRRRSSTYSNVDEKRQNRKSMYSNISGSRDSLYSNYMDDSIWSEDSMYDPSLNTSFSSVTLPTPLNDQSSYTTHSSVGPGGTYSPQFPVDPSVLPEMVRSYTLGPPSPSDTLNDQEGEKDYRYHAPRYLQRNSSASSPATDSFYYRRNLSCPHGLDSRNFVFVMQYKFNYKGK